MRGERCRSTCGDAGPGAGLRTSRRSFLQAGLGAAACGVLGAPAAWAQRGSSSEPAAWTLAAASAALQAREVSPVELVQACLQRIERFDPLLNAFITVRFEESLAEARRAEAELQAGRRLGPLHGVPIAVKDNIETAGVRTTGASALLADHVPQEDAAVAHRLREAGAILLGKLNLHEFAYGGSSTASHFGTMRNPWDPERATGGSSGGSAAAVAADLCYAALGTDTAGSVRMPASLCGITGLKPSYGLVSTRGVYILSWVLDHVGPMCKSVEDAALMLSAMAGHDAREPTSLDVPLPDYHAALATDLSGLRLGIPGSPFYDDLDPEMAAAVQAATHVLGEMVAEVREVTLPETIPGTRLWGPEAYAFHREWVDASPELYLPGTRASLQRYAEADALDYVLARREVDLLRRQVLRVFEDVDVLVTPIMRAPAPLLADGGGGGPSANAAAFNVLGLPAMSVPCGFSAEGLPLGVQIAAAPLADATVLALGHAYQQVTDWHRARPELPT